MFSAKKVSIISLLALLTSIGSIIGASSANAAGFSSIRIGDKDGFGYGKAEGYSAANGGKANVSGKGVLTNGDFLPDLNKNGKLATGQGDDFDNRIGAEKSNKLVTGSGFSDKGSTGSKYTDISLSTSFLKNLPGVDLIANKKEEKINERKQIEAEKITIAANIKDLTQKIQDQQAAKTAKIDALKDERTTVQDKIKELQNQITNVNKGKDSDVEALISDIRLKEADQKDASGSEKAIQRKIDNLQNQLQNTIDNTETKPVRKERKIEALVSEIKLQEAEKEAASVKGKAIQAEIEGLQAQVEQTKGSKIASLNTQIVGLNSKVSEFNTQIQNVREEIDSNIASLVDTRKDLFAEQQGKSEKIAELNQEITTLGKELGNSRIPQAEFAFDFSVKKKDIKASSPLFFNLLFGDYDVKDAKVGFQTANGGYFEKQLTKQKNNQGQDGLIQSAFVELNFNDIFTANGGSFDGFLKAKLIANDEPYMAFDYAEISTGKIAVPEPTAIFGLITFGAFATRSIRKRK
jgi:peptidoglycan hydrolase CwlO-like protein